MADTNIIELKDIYKTFTDGKKSFNAVENARVADFVEYVNQLENELHDNLEKLYSKAKDFGGLISGEHRLGVSKRDFFFAEPPTQNVVLMNAIKKSFDEKGILNPKISYVK